MQVDPPFQFLFNTLRCNSIELRNLKTQICVSLFSTEFTFKAAWQNPCKYAHIIFTQINMFYRYFCIIGFQKSLVLPSLLRHFSVLLYPFPPLGMAMAVHSLFVNEKRNK